MSSRPDWDDWAFGIVNAVATRGDCTRRRVGALIVDTNHRIAGAGYNGGRPGGPSCLEGDCPRGRHYEVIDEDPDDHWSDGCEDGCHTEDCRGCGRQKYCGPGPCEDSLCICDNPWPCPHAIPRSRCKCCNPWPCPDAVEPGSNYDNCLASHAEINAVMDVDNRARLDGAVLYCTDPPCDGCAKTIENTTRIAAIRWPEGIISFPR